MKKILILNGPNLNLLGNREIDVYGEKSLNDIKKICEEKCNFLKLSYDFIQSNNEGELINSIQSVENGFEGLIINPAAFTHTSVAILDALRAISKETKLQNITSVRIKKGDYEIEISSQSNATKQEFIQLHENKTKQQKVEIIEENVNQENIVKSPMVGVAYLSSDPNSSPYVKVGQHVKQGDTLLLIEAMKTFNEIKAPKSGVIKKIMVLNSQPVEFGDVLLTFE